LHALAVLKCHSVTGLGEDDLMIADSPVLNHEGILRVLFKNEDKTRTAGATRRSDATTKNGPLYLQGFFKYGPLG
jgi:hypothetical protein